MQKRLLVDWLTMSFKVSPEQSSCFLRSLYEKLSFPIQEGERVRSHFGLEYSMYYHGLQVHCSDKLIILECSGKGCRTVEELNPGWNWYGFLNGYDYYIQNRVKDGKYFPVNISRLDVACDLLENKRITLPFLQDCVLKRRFVCKSSQYRVEIGNVVRQIYFGSPTSSRLMRIYDKGLEQKIPDYKWVRFEMQLRDDSATSFYLNLVKHGGDFARCYHGVLHDYLRFLVKPNVGDKNQSKIPMVKWWKDFLEGVGQIPQLYLPGEVYDLPALSKFLSKQCGSSLKTYIKANGGDWSELWQMVEGAKLNRRQKELLDDLEREDETVKYVPSRLDWKEVIENENAPL